MQLQNTETLINLARSFAGESQAGMRYQMIADAAMREKLPALADKVREIAKNETQHAKAFYAFIRQKAGSLPNVEITAGYPFESGTLQEMLSFAAKDERAEYQRIYPSFADTAEREGFPDIAKKFRLVAEIEKQHEIIFAYLAGAIQSGTLYRSETPMLWHCSECGFQVTATAPWEVCPVCGKERGYTDLHLPFTGEKG